MDINETLRKLRAALASEEQNMSGEYSAEIIELFEALDGWMKRGGFLPDEWSVLSTGAPMVTWDRHGIADNETTHPNRISHYRR